MQIENSDRLEARYLAATAALEGQSVESLKVQIENAQLLQEVLKRDLQTAQEKHKKAEQTLTQFAETIGTKYGLQDGDQINFETGEITQANKTSSKESPKGESSENSAETEGSARPA